MAIRLFGGHHVDLPEVKAFRVREGGLEASPAQKMVVDGEVCMATPVRFSVLPHALKVVVPENWEP
jgi:diacylglycerol kinase family enzyme